MRVSQRACLAALVGLSAALFACACGGEAPDEPGGTGVDADTESVTEDAGDGEDLADPGDPDPGGVTDPGSSAGDTGEPLPPICEPGVTGCLSDLARAKCNYNGTVWLPIEECPGGTICDGNPAKCRKLICTPGELVCVSGGKATRICNQKGTDVTAVEAVPCPAGTWCFEGEGCRAINCIPGTYGCMGDGGLGVCDGDGYVAQGDGCKNDECLTCVTKHEYVQCQNPSEVTPVPTHSCPGGTSCADGLGCFADPCTPGKQKCGLTNAYGTCAEAPGDSGEPFWNATECNPQDICTPTAEDKAVCQFNCAASVTCKLEKCQPLPPFGDAGSWIVPANNPTTLPVSFGVGLSKNFKIAYVNIAPITNPQDGKFLEGLEPLVEVAGEPQGNIIVREDGFKKDLVCIPLTTALYAELDLVFVLDVTGSMGSSIQKVKESVIDLASFLAGAGLDVRFGVVPFDDYAPAQGDTLFDLSYDMTALTSFVAGLNADGGGDGPENSLDGLKVAAQKMDWRAGAQKAMLLATDNSMHVKDDGTSFTDQSLEEALELLQEDGFVVHTVSNSLDDDPFVSGKYPNPRLVSCATGGTSADLSNFVKEDIKVSTFAQALSHSFHCIFVTADPIGEHDVQVDVHYNHQGTKLFGSTILKKVSYKVEE